MATEKDQLEEKYNLLVDNVIEPMATAQVYDLELSAPISFNDWQVRDLFVKKLNSLNISERDAIVFSMTIKLDQDFKTNMINTLDNISDKKKTVTPSTCTASSWGGYLSCDYSSLWDGIDFNTWQKSFRISLFNKESKNTDIYLIKDIDQASKKKNSLEELDPEKPYAWITDEEGLCEYRNDISPNSRGIHGQKSLSYIQINFLNSSNAIIDSIDITNQSYTKANIDGWEEKNIGFMTLSYNLSGLLDRDQSEIMFTAGNQAHLINRQLEVYRTGPRTCGSPGNYRHFSQVAVYDELTWWVILKLNQDTLRNAKSYVVEYKE